jgi:diaminohydroxyphosphoribosylaminopyrimidine deaminase/5-amino-6-(5-phosphoribosylamino)uracil reductase
VLVEAGSRLTSTLLRAGLADKLVTFIAPLLLGGEHTTTQNLRIENIQAALKLTSLEVVSCGQDILITSYPEYS